MAQGGSCQAVRERSNFQRIVAQRWFDALRARTRETARNLVAEMLNPYRECGYVMIAMIEICAAVDTTPAMGW